jgi:PIN domain nuclease of toxin-antitoxin system
MILLDTHTFIWLASDRSQLSSMALSAIETEGDSLMISIVTAWEIALLHKKERLALPTTPSEFIERATKRHTIRELPLNRSTAIDAVNLPDLHNDPFDRILIAEAMSKHCSLISKDSKIAAYPDVKVIW